MTTVTLHGVLGEQVGSIWKIAINSIGEACHAIEVLSNRRLFRNLLNNDKKGLKYKVLVNGGKLKFPPKDIYDVKISELCLKRKDIKEIDIIPVIEGAEDVIAIIGGVLLIVAGIVVAGMSFGSAGVLGGAMIIGGLGLITAGVINLLSSPPVFESMREIAGGGKTSYLFSGPQQTVGESGPVPLLYGRLLIGSQVVSAAYVINDRSTDEGLTT